VRACRLRVARIGAAQAWGALWCSPHDFGHFLTKINGVTQLRRNSRSDAIFLEIWLNADIGANPADIVR
jgi:hypothetical protein